MRVIAAIDSIGTALALQIFALISSLLIVTAVPASVALQRQLVAAAAGEKTGVASFTREFIHSWRQSWIAGVVFPVVVVAGVVSVLFWSAVAAPAGPIATAVLVFLAGLGLSVALAALKWSAVERVSTPSGWVRGGSRYLLRSPLRGLWATVMMIGWISLALYLPSLLLVGSALVPALIVRWCLADPPPGSEPEGV